MTELREPDWMDAMAGDTEVAIGLRGYVAHVAASVGVGLESCAIDPQPPRSAYIALDTKLARFPRRDVALLWDESQGWSVCVETHSGEDLIVVAYLGCDVIAAPAVVQAFVESVVAGLPVGAPNRPTTGRARDSLAMLLRPYTL